MGKGSGGARLAAMPRRVEAVTASQPGRLGKYELGERIASGGMAEVYLARLPQRGNRMVALKVMHEHLCNDEAHIAMFQDEAALLAKLAHPSTVQLYESGVDDGRYFMAMELLIGDSLLRVWQAFHDHGAKIPYVVTAWIGARVAEGLHHAHELRDKGGWLQNVVHRDVNPSNIQITFDGRVKILDFGLAKSDSKASQTAVGIVKGKLGYISPEQIDGQPPDRRADIFAWGTSLWELTVDRRLFRVDGDIETIRAIQKCEVPDPRALVADYPAPLWTVIRQALARDPRQRYQTALEMSHDLDACARQLGPPVTASTISKLMGQVCAWAG
jgi:serine/threonine protein kinase